MNKEIPRRNQLDLCKPSELAIYSAIEEVEKLGASVKLTDAILKLNEARELVGDFIDQTIKDWRDIKTYEDACEELGIDPETVAQENDTDDEIAYKMLKVVVRAINQGWVPDWNNSNQYKYWPYFNLSSGSGFSDSGSYFGYEWADVGSRLCFESREKCNYAATQFSDLYLQFLTINKE